MSKSNEAYEAKCEKARIELLRSNSAMLDLLERAAECLNGYADVRDGDDRGPRPNDAMSMESEITEFLQRVRK
jgi:hypothetical protein